MFSRSAWPLVTALASGAMLAVAVFYFQAYRGLPPCPLCLDQRNWHWAVVAVSLAGFSLSRWKPALGRWILIAIGLVLLGSAVQAAFHVAVEQHWVIYRCDAAVDLGDLTLDMNAPLEVPQCDKVLWSLFGISMAGYNSILSLILALATFVIALKPERKA